MSAYFLHTKLTFPAALLMLSASIVMGQPVREDEEVIVLEEFKVQHQRPEASDAISPLSRDVESVFPGAESLLELPRAVTVVTPESMEQLAIDGFDDLDRIGAGTQRVNLWGIAGTPYLRGVKAGVFFNGMLRAYQSNNMPVSFGSLEALEIVKGPAPAHLSPTLAGGYVNFTPKSPYFDESRGSIDLEVGSWNHYRGQVDVGGPFFLGEWPAAYRVSVTGQDADSFYQYLKDDFVSAYASMRTNPTKDISAYFGGEVYVYRSSENPGWNRPTQELIENQRYVIGEPVDMVDPEWNSTANRDLVSWPAAVNSGVSHLNALVVSRQVVQDALARGEVSADAVNALLDLQDPDDRARAYGQPLPSTGQRDPNYDASGNADLDATLARLAAKSSSTGYRYTEEYFAEGGKAFTEEIPAEAVLAADEDYADSEDFIFFFDLEGRGNPDLVWKNQFFVEGLQTEKRSTYGYSNASEQLVIADKLTLTTELPELNSSLSFGASFRFTYAKTLEDFFAEPFGRRDLSTDTVSDNSMVLAGSQTAPATGGLNLWSPAIGPNVTSDLYQTGVFGVMETQVNERLRVYSSLRLERAWYATGVPEEMDLADADYIADVSKTGDTGYYMASVNPVYQLTSHVFLYGAVQVGTGLTPSDSGAIFGEGNFTHTELYEVGVKTSFLDDRLYGSVAFYHWDQARFSALNARAMPLRAKGMEIEIAAQPLEGLSIIASVDAQRVHLRTDNLGYGAFPQSEEDWALNAGYFNAGGDRDTPNNPDNVYAGFPEVTAKLFARYQHSSGFGISGGPTWRDSFWHNHDHTLRLPASTVWIASLFYEGEDWDVRLTFENLFDEDYYYSADPVFSSNTLLTKAPPRSWTLAVTRRF